MLNRLAFGKGSGWIAVVACWVFITDCTYALKEEDLQRIGFVKVDSSSEDPAEEDGSVNNGKKENDEAKQSRKYLDHLILGEADFSFTEALIRKHQTSYPNLPKHIIATELRSMDTLARGYPDTFFTHMVALHQLGMRCQGFMVPGLDGKYPSFADEYQRLHNGGYLWNYQDTHQYQLDDGMIVTGVDATRLHEIFPMVYNGGTVSGFHFERIHFNFPMPPGGFSKVTMQPGSSKEILAIQKLMHDFFASASQIQIAGDRIHVTIPCRWETSYGIINAGSNNNYRLIKVHRFANRSYLKISGDTTEEVLERYPGYLHNFNIGVNSDDSKYDDTKDKVRNGHEYVFEKIDGEQILVDSRVESDDDSSDYLDDADGRWYTGDDMNRLMDHYFGQPADERYRDTQDLGRGRMHVINVEALDGEVLRQNLEDRERLMVDAGEAVPQLLVPLNVGEGAGNHWVGLYINRMPDQAGIIQIFYFDSLGNPMPRRLQTILREIYGSREGVRFYQNENCYQTDGYNCGAWVIEFFRAMHRAVSRSLHRAVSRSLEEDDLFLHHFRIVRAKTLHRKILHPNL